MGIKEENGTKMKNGTQALAGADNTVVPNGYMPCSWEWLDGTQEVVIAEIEEGNIIDVYSTEDQEWIAPGDLGGPDFEVNTIYATFEEDLAVVEEEME